MFPANSSTRAEVGGAPLASTRWASLQRSAEDSWAPAGRGGTWRSGRADWLSCVEHEPDSPPCPRHTLRSRAAARLPAACLERLPSCPAPPAQSRERGVDPGRRAVRKLPGSLPTLCGQLLFSWRRVFPRKLGAAGFCKYSGGNRSGRCSAESRSWVGSRLVCKTLGKSCKDSLPSLAFVGLHKNSVCL